MTLGVSITFEENPNVRTTFLLLQPRFLSSRVTFTFTEPIDPRSFTLDDTYGLDPEIARLSGLTQESATVWTATLTAVHSVQQQQTRLGLGLYGINDAHGQRAGSGGVIWSTPGVILVDTVAPDTASIRLADSELTADEITDVTFTFAEKVTGFTLDDVDLSNAEGTMVPGSLRCLDDGRTYTARMKANENAQVPIWRAVRVKLYGVLDEYGTPGEGNSNASNLYTVQTRRPVLESAAVDGHQLLLRFDQDLDASRSPGAESFRVSIDGVAVADAVAVVAMLGRTVTLTLTTLVTSGQAVTVGYDDPRPDINDTHAIQNATGNDALSFTNRQVTNDTPETTPPALVVEGANAPTVNGNLLELHYTDANHLSATGPAHTAFTVRVDGVPVDNAVTGVTVDPAAKTVTLTLATAVRHGQTVTVSYTDRSTANDDNAIQDAAGNDAPGFTRQSVTNNSPDATAPVLDTAVIAGNALTLHYTEATHLGNGAVSASAFRVLVDGTAVAVTNVDMSAAQNNRVTLTLARPVTQHDEVTLDYTKPASGPVIEDAAGNDADSFQARAVGNRTDNEPPVLVIGGANTPTVNGQQLVLHYTDANHLSATGPAHTAFTVRVDGAVGNHAVTGVAVDPVTKTVTLTLATAVTPGQRVAVSYTDPGAANDLDAIQDAAGNDAASITDQPVRNDTLATVTPTPPTTDSTPPVLVTTGTDAPTVNGQQLVLHYTDDNHHLSATGPAKTAFTVRVDDVNNAVTGVSVNAASKTVTLTLATAVTPGQAVSVSYTDPTPGLDDSNAIQDAAGNDAANITNQPVTNSTPAPAPPAADSTPPVLVTTGTDAPTVNGQQLVLHYTDDNHLSATGPAATAFTVRVDDVNNAVTGVSVNAASKTVTLTLATAVTPGQAVSVSYADPTPGLDDSNAIQDAAGNDAANITNQPVTNSTPAPVTPTPTTQTAPSSDPALGQDRDSVPNVPEDQTPGITRSGGATPVDGDGNGDGIRDSQQSAVASMNGMTLVASSQDGKPTSSDSSVHITDMEQKAAPANLPKGLEMPMGLLRFETRLAAAGSPESFSLYVDPERGVNGYWVRDNTGVWMNLASELHGGKTVTEGNRLRLDFKITDGGQFDADGKADGLITVPGTAGHMQLSIVGQPHDLVEHLGFWF